MRILFVAMANSVHTARWLKQLRVKEHELYLYPSISTFDFHQELENVTVYRPAFGKLVIKKQRSNYIKGKTRQLFDYVLYAGQKILLKEFQEYQINRLTKIINKVKPDIIHSLEFQAAGYLTLEAKKRLKNKFPTWIVTNWGSDIYLFGRLSEHEPKIRDILKECDYYSCECKRDAYLARQFGFRKDILPIFPNTGGIDINLIGRLRQPGKISDRRVIMLKGYQGWAGRALVGLRALERCSDILSDYIVAIYSGANDVYIAAELFSKNTGIPIRIIPLGTHQEEILSWHGKARISIGLSISDGISTSLLEAMAMGSFPIQSFTACADEWICDGQSGLLVHPDDPEMVEVAIRRAITEDKLVNEAAMINLDTIRENLDPFTIQSKVTDFYNGTLNKNKTIF